MGPFLPPPHRSLQVLRRLSNQAQRFKQDLSSLRNMSDEAQSFIVVYKSHATDDQIQKHVDDVVNNGGEVGHRYESVFKGFSAKLKPDSLQNLQGDDLIDYIEPDQEITIQPTGSAS